MSKTVTIGEIMLRLSPENNLRFLQTTKFSAFFGGAEANVAVALAKWGMDTLFVTKIPEHEMGQAALCALKKEGVDVSRIVFGKQRLGIYYYEKGLGARNGKVIYDRENSAFSNAEINDFKWEEIFNGANWLHITGITPALSENAERITIFAIKKAKEKGIKVSFDLNYRKNLWSAEKAGRVFDKCLLYADILISNAEQAKILFPDSVNVNNNLLNENKYIDMAEKLKKKFNLEYVVFTARKSYNVFDTSFSAFIYDGKSFEYSKEYMLKVADGIGGGDAFAAGLIYCLKKGMDLQTTVNFASAAAMLKHTIEGDFSCSTLEEVQNAVSCDIFGRTER